jgi:hypothetical protein
MRLRLASLPVGLFILLALILGGCGSSPNSRSGNGVAAKTPAEILSTAKAAAAAAASVHVAGSIVSEGKPISLDMELVGRNEGKGSVTLEGLEIRLIDVDGAVFVKGSKTFYTRFAGAKAANLLQGKWIEGSATKGPLASFAALADLDKVIDSTLADHGTLSRAPLAETARSTSPPPGCRIRWRSSSLPSAHAPERSFSTGGTSRCPSQRRPTRSASRG